MKIAGHTIGNGKPCFIIAEAGVNHNGDIQKAKALIIEAKKAGADAIKFQAFKTENLVTQSAEKAQYQIENTGEDETQYSMLKKLELGEADFKELSAYARHSKIIFLSSAFDAESVDMLEKLHTPAYKVGSGELTNHPLLAYIAEKKTPMIISTGMSTLVEIAEAFELVKSHGCPDVALLHCVSNYPSQPSDANLRVIQTLHERFQVPVGYSDHTTSLTLPSAAVALGATIIEKHLTLDHALPGPDHKASLDPNEFKTMVDNIREVESALGDGVKRVLKSEVPIQKAARKSIVAKVDIPKGTLITHEMLDLKRPGTGIPPKQLDKVAGKRAKRHIPKDALLKWTHLE